MIIKHDLSGPSFFFSFVDATMWKNHNMAAINFGMMQATGCMNLHIRYHRMMGYDAGDDYE